MHEKTVKKFGVEGILGSDSRIPGFREQREAELLREMRDKGYVPMLEYGPQWSTHFDIEKNRYLFVLSMYGVHVGGRQAWEIEGITAEGSPIPRITPTKSKPSSEKSESN